jgi:hypothetical protein
MALGQAGSVEIPFETQSENRICTEVFVMLIRVIINQQNTEIYSSLRLKDANGTPEPQKSTRFIAPSALLKSFQTVSIAISNLAAP